MHKIAYSTVESSINCTMLCTWCYMFSLGWIEMWWDHGKSWLWGILTASSRENTSHWDLGGQAVGNCRLGILSSLKCIGALVSHDDPCDMHHHWYVSLLQQSIIPALQARQCDTTTVFMQNGVPPHIAHCMKQLLCICCHFGDDRIISLKFPTAWPSKSFDLNDWFLTMGIPQDYGLPWSHYISIWP